MQMKKPRTPSLHQSSQRKKNAGLKDSGKGNGIGNGTKRQNPNKNHSAPMTYFKSAVKKCASVFALFLPGKRKTASEAVENDDTKNTHKVRGVSCESDE